MRIDDGATGTSSPGLAMDASGSAVAVWVQNGAGDASVWSNRYLPGSGWGTPAQVENLPLDPAQPMVAMDAAGNALVAWHQWENGGSTAWSHRLRAAGSTRPWSR
ncbi:MAG: hypothetical protein EOO25_22175, partial [Comamonadaceae bacterium]